MVGSPIVIAVILVGLGSVIVPAAIIALSRHKKAATGELALVGALASVEKVLEPEGSVLVAGELWRARSRTGVIVNRGCHVRVVGASAHWLEVEPTG